MQVVDKDGNIFGAGIEITGPDGKPKTSNGGGIPSGPAGGDLSGIYPNPSVVWNNGTSTYNSLYYPLSSNPAAYITSAALLPYLTSAIAASTYYPIPTGTISQYIRGNGTLATFPSIPTVTPAALTKVDDTNVTLTLGGSPSTSLLQATSLTLGWTGTLADSRIASATTWNAKQAAITTGTISQYFRGDLSLATFPTIPTVGTWGALNYPTWSAGTPFVKMTASGTFSLDTNTYQPTLVSGTNIKTINSTSLLGSGDIILGTGTVTSVSGTTPISVSGGPAPVVSIQVASGSQNGYLANSDWTSFNNKQSQLVSGTNIKTVNSNTLLGSGDVAVQATLVSGTNIKTVNGTSILGSGNIVAGGAKVSQAPTTSFNQYVAAAGVGNTILFSANVLSSLGQIIDVDFLARNNSGLSTVLRIYINSSASTSGATQIGNFTITGLADTMVRYQHRFSLTNDGSGNWCLIGADSFALSTDLVATGSFNFSVVGVGAATKSYIIVTLNQGGSLIAATINY